MNESIVREHLQRMLDWHDAHATLDAAVEGISDVAMRGIRPDGFPHSLWELLEHIRIAQADILDFCRNPEYTELEWPEQYWPLTPAPPDDEAWQLSIDQIRQDRAAFRALAADSDLDLTARIPHGAGQTYLRELLLVLDHTAYHVGQMVAVRKVLGIWEGG